jgi:hypothetical protein
MWFEEEECNTGCWRANKREPLKIILVLESKRPMSFVNLLGRETAERRRAKSGQYSARIVRNRMESSGLRRRADEGREAKGMKGIVAKGSAGIERPRSDVINNGVVEEDTGTISEDSQNLTSDDAYFERVKR